MTKRKTPLPDPEEVKAALSELADSCDVLEDLSAKYVEAVIARTEAMVKARSVGARMMDIREITGLSQSHSVLLMNGTRGPKRPDMRWLT